MTSELVVAQRVAAEARQEIPSALLRVGGRALYSPAATLVSGSKYYFLGANPGEAPSASHLHSTITVECDLQRLESGWVTDHGYLDEQWKGFMPGHAPIQLRGQRLFALLDGGASSDGKALLRTTPTSNFVLQRSPSLAALKQRTGTSPAQLAQQYWPFHRAVIRETGCAWVITHAISIARQLARSLGLGDGYARPSGWGGTLATCYAWQLSEGPMLLAIPSLSRFVPDERRAPALSAFFREFIPSGALKR